MQNRELLRMLRAKSYEPRPEGVVLASGKTSDFYIDCKKTFMTPLGMAYCADALLGRLHDIVSDGVWAPCDYVAGTGVGGGPLAIGVMLRARDNSLRISALYIRDTKKDHGSRGRIEPALDPWMHPGPPTVVLVEDVVTTGTASIIAAKALVEAGFLVQGILILVDREEGAMANIKEAGFDARALFTKTDLLKEG